MESDDEIETVSLLHMLKQQDHVEMLSRSYLNSHGILDQVIDAAEKKGEVVVGEGGFLASVLLTLDGDNALAEYDDSSVRTMR